MTKALAGVTKGMATIPEEEDLEHHSLPRQTLLPPCPRRLWPPCPPPDPRHFEDLRTKALRNAYPDEYPFWYYWTFGEGSEFMSDSDSSDSQADLPENKKLHEERLLQLETQNQQLQGTIDENKKLYEEKLQQLEAKQLHGDRGDSNGGWSSSGGGSSWNHSQGWSQWSPQSGERRESSWGNDHWSRCNWWSPQSGERERGERAEPEGEGREELSWGSGQWKAQTWKGPIDLWHDDGAVGWVSHGARLISAAVVSLMALAGAVAVGTTMSGERP